MPMTAMAERINVFSFIKIYVGFCGLLIAFGLVKHYPVPGFKMHLDSAHLLCEILAYAVDETATYIGSYLRPCIGEMLIELPIVLPILAPIS